VRAALCRADGGAPGGTNSGPLYSPGPPAERLRLRYTIDYIPRFAVSWFGCTQPDKVAEIMQGGDDGLLARFMWFWSRCRR
jgi:hypothetical protein